jgi:hypothetical protein
MEKSAMGNHVFSRMAVLALGSAIGLTASAATIVDWKPQPTSPGIAEFVWNGAFLDEGPGNLSNGDGQLPRNLQTPGGLDMSTPFTINGVPGSEIDLVTGATTFMDAQLTINGFAATGPAGVVFNTAVQPLGNGDFTLTSTTGVLLLHGTVQSSTITGNIGSSAGAVFSANNVQYDSGLIFNALVAAGGSLSANDFSFSFVSVTPSIAIGGGGFLAPFTTDATGLYQADVVPEPMTLGVAAASFGLLGLRRRRYVG